VKFLRKITIQDMSICNLGLFQELHKSIILRLVQAQIAFLKKIILMVRFPLLFQ